jgi:hypothetical protein
MALFKRMETGVHHEDNEEGQSSAANQSKTDVMQVRISSGNE